MRFFLKILKHMCPLVQKKDYLSYGAMSIPSRWPLIENTLLEQFHNPAKTLRSTSNHE